MKTMILKLSAIGLLLALPVLNFFVWHSLSLGIISMVLLISGTSFLMGRFLLADHTGYEQSLVGLLATIVCIVLIGSASFYLFGFSDIHSILLLLLLPWIAVIIDWQSEDSALRTLLNSPASKASIRLNQVIVIGKRLWDAVWHNLPNLILACLYSILFLTLIASIASHATSLPIRSPWEVLPRSILIVYGCATFILFLLLSSNGKRDGAILNNFFHRISTIGPWETLRKFRLYGSHYKRGGRAEAERLASQETGMRVAETVNAIETVKSHDGKNYFPALFLISCHLFLTLSLAGMVYQIGYGFDPFVHRAAEQMLAEEGTISPKPLLYIGQYVLVVFVSKLAFLSLSLVDKWLLPILASLFIPLFIMLTTRIADGNAPRSIALRTTLLTLLFPLSLFFFTVPQNLGNLFFLACIFLSVCFLHGSFPVVALWSIAAAAMAIHPLSGIPSCIYVILLILVTRPYIRFRLILLGSAVFAGAVAMPAAIAWGNRHYMTGQDTPEALMLLPNLLPSYLPFLSLAHTAELWYRLLPMGFIIAALTGCVLLARRQRYGLIIPPLLIATTLLTSYFMVRTQSLPAIIAYERGEFAFRLLELALLSLAPLACMALYEIIRRSTYRHTPTTGAITAALLIINFYYTYPRTDAFAKSRGYSVSHDDIAAVRWIETDAQGAPFIVLANQSVAAASLQEFGFKQYFTAKDCKQPSSSCQLFYYPIPTSSPLYQYYLDMVYQEPSRETIEKAMALTGVSRAYFVLNDYWLDADKIADRASFAADASTTLNSVRIYTYINSADQSESTN